MNLPKTLSFCAMTLFTMSTQATVFSGEVAEDAYVTVGGYDLAWASPCSDGILERSCGAVDLSEQSSYGWNIMTSNLFSELNINANTFIVDYSSANTQLYRGNNYAKAAGWFSRHRHIDISNGYANLWSFSDTVDNRYAETITYRVSSIPEPSAFILLGMGLIGFGFYRKSKKA